MVEIHEIQSKREKEVHEIMEKELHEVIPKQILVQTLNTCLKSKRKGEIQKNVSNIEPTIYEYLDIIRARESSNQVEYILMNMIDLYVF